MFLRKKLLNRGANRQPPVGFNRRLYELSLIHIFNNQGELLVRREDGHVEEIYAGEVSVRGVYGYV